MLFCRTPSSHASGPFTMPSPQKAVKRHAGVQPDPYVVLPDPSSHSSSPSTIPSPQRAVVGSTTQMSEQPSPAIVLPSSQVSGPTTSSSPQIGAHRRPGAGQDQPASTSLQYAEQP